MTQFEQHAEYTEMLPVWRRCRDASVGQRAIHKGKDKYLPKLTGQTDTDYKAYVLRALYYNATGRTVDAMSGLIFRKEPIIEVPEAMQSWLEDINLGGTSLDGIASKAVEETITVGRGGLFVDHPQSLGETITKDKADELAIRPYMTYYHAENIIDWSIARFGNVTKLSRVILSELDNNGEDQIRELIIQDGVYIQNIWAMSDGKWALVDTIIPVMNGDWFSDIPFFFLAPKEVDCCVQASPIEDLVNVNIAHYQASADLRNGAHLSGLPTPYAIGVDDDDFEFELGGMGLALPLNAEVGFLQCGSEGFSTLEKLLEADESRMASLGARAIAPEKRMAETAESQTIKRGGENSVLASLAGAVEQQFKKALEFMRDWAGLSGAISFELNKDYIPSTMTAQELTALLSVVQAGRMSGEAFHDNLVRGEVISEGTTYEDEQDRITESAPSLSDVD